MEFYNFKSKITLTVDCDNGVKSHIGNEIVWGKTLLIIKISKEVVEPNIHLNNVEIRIVGTT